MADNDSLDGTELETTQEAPAAPEQPAEQPAQVATEQQPQTDVTNIPDQFENLSADQFEGLDPNERFNRYNKANSQVGRYKKEMERMAQTLSQYERMMQQLYSNSGANQQSTPSSLPGNEARPGQQQDFNELFYEKPIDAIRQVVGDEVNQGIQKYRTEEQKRQEQVQMQRQQQIREWDDRALSALRLDEGTDFTEDHELMMQVLTKKDEAAIRNKLSNPNLTEQDVANLVKDYYKKADEILRGPKDQAQKVFHQAQKEAATNGAPNSRAQTGNQPQDGEFPDWFQEQFPDPEAAKRFSFLIQD